MKWELQLPRLQQIPLPFAPFSNSGLFSTHWLTHRIQLEPEWVELRDAAKRALSELGTLWRRERTRIDEYGEQQLEYAFIQPVFEMLGWRLYYQTFLDGRKPDYALFTDDAKLDAAIRAGKNAPDFWEHAALVADSKASAVPLDRPSIINNEREYPPQQMEWYLNRSNRGYGILTNGGVWRLIPRDRAAYQGRFDTFFEFDLRRFLTESVTPRSDLTRTEQLLDEFLYFFLLFGPHAFVPIAGRKVLIDRAVSGSSEYRLGIGEDLRERAFHAVCQCISGLLAYAPNALHHNEHLSVCRNESFILLYRLLFIMYAEDRGLLPYARNRLYTANRSLRRHREDIAATLRKIELGDVDDYSREKTELWDDLCTLFDLIDRGGARYAVPPYNGGLFDPEEHPFWEQKKIPDWHLARVIHELGQAPDPALPDAGLFRVDYRDLAIQHLGSIYESLLELEPKFASVPMVVVARRIEGRLEEKIVPASAPVPAGFQATEMRYTRGSVYLQTNKGERRATGSYYTPDHIVKYIVETTLGPICESVSAILAGEIATGEQRCAATPSAELQDALLRLRASFDERILALNILDPAMGSGHFLLRACAYLAEQIATHPCTSTDSPLAQGADESALVYWKRMVAESCLFGVDMNDLAVELAKLALWLETVNANQPLTFLNHHLRNGNSLVGAKVSNLGVLPGEAPLLGDPFIRQVEEKLPILLHPLAEIRALPSDSVDQVKQKQRLFRQFEQARESFRRTANVWSATFLPESRPVSVDDYQRALHSLGKPRDFARVAAEEWFRNAENAARHESFRCFHWELEFPPVFFDDRGRKLRPGFDAIIGNPPYDVLSEAESGRDLAALRAFIDAEPAYRPSLRGKNNLYKLFICRGLDLLAPGGRLGFITPMAVLGDDQAAEIRREVLRQGSFAAVEAFPQKDDPRRRVFPDAKLSTAIIVLQKNGDGSAADSGRFTSQVHQDQRLEVVEASLVLRTPDIPLYDPVNLSIASCSQADWDLATRIMQSGRMTRLKDVAEFFQGEVNETNERKSGNLVDESEGGKLVTRGACICLYIARKASQGTEIYLNVNRYLDGKSSNSKAFHHRQDRVCLQESSPQNNFRRIISAFVPAGEFCNHTINYCPTSKCSVDLRLLLCVLNSKLSEWYFRLGSTNAHVSHYQLYNLPFPHFAAAGTRLSDDPRTELMQSLNASDTSGVLELLRPLLNDPPFDPLIADVIVAAVDRITAIEKRRGEIPRTARSALDPAAQPFQDLIDRLFFKLAGLTDGEAAGLEARLARML